MDDKLYILWNSLKGDENAGVPDDYSEFKKNMENEDFAKVFHSGIIDYVGDEHKNYDAFAEFWDIKKKENSQGSGSVYESSLYRPPADAIQSQSAVEIPKPQPWLDIKTEPVPPPKNELPESELEIIKISEDPLLKQWREGSDITSRIDALLDKQPIGSFSPPEGLSPTEQAKWYERGIQRRFANDESYKKYLEYLVAKDKEKHAVVGVLTGRQYLKEMGVIDNDIDAIGLKGLDDMLTDESFDNIIDSMPQFEQKIIERGKPNSAEFIEMSSAMGSGTGKLMMLINSVNKALTEHGAKLTPVTPAPFSPGVTWDFSEFKGKTEEGESVAGTALMRHRKDVEEVQSWLSQRDAKTWEHIAAGLGSIAMDWWAFSVGGAIGRSPAQILKFSKDLLKVGGATSAVADAAIKKSFWAMAKSGMASTGGALGFHSAINDVLTQIGDKPIEEYSIGQTLKAGAISTATGVGVGLLGSYTYALSNALTQRAIDKVLLHGYKASDLLKDSAMQMAVKGAGFASEVGLFELSNKLQGGEFSLESLTQNIGVLGVLKMRGIGTESFKKSKIRDMDFTLTEKSLLGAENSKDVFDKYKSKESFNDLMKRDDVPYLLKAKALYVVKGEYPDRIPFPSEIKIENDVIKKYDNEGRLLDAIDGVKDPVMAATTVNNMQRAIDLILDTSKYYRISSKDRLIVDEGLRKAGIEKGADDPIFVQAMLRGGSGYTEAETKAMKVLNESMRDMIEIVERPKAKKTIIDKFIEGEPKEVGDIKKEVEVKESLKELTADQVAREARIKEMWDAFKEETARAPKRPRGKVSMDASKERSDKLVQMLDLPKKLREDVKSELKQKGELEEGTSEFNRAVDKEVKNRNPYQDIPDRVFTQMGKLAAEAYKSDAKYQKAVNYIDKVLTDIEARKYEEERLGLVDKTIELTSTKKVLKKGGKRPVVRNFVRGEGDAYKELFNNINDLITKGRSESFPNPENQIKENLNKIDAIERQESLTKEDRDQINILKTENEIMSFANMGDKNLYETRDMFENVKRINGNQKLLAQESREANMKKYEKMIGDRGEIVKRIFYNRPEIKEIRKLDEEISKLENKKTLSVKEEKRLNSLIDKKDDLWRNVWPKARRYKKITGARSLESASLYSFNSMLMRNDPYISDKLPIYKDYLNEWARPIVKRGMDSFDKLTDQLISRDFDELQSLLGVKSEGEMNRRLIDLTHDKTIKIELVKENGKKVVDVITPTQAMQKIFQWNDLDWRQIMEMPLTKYRDIGMGFSQDTIDSMVAQLSKNKTNIDLMNWIKRTWDRYVDELYDPAYKAENGTSFKKEGFYWTGQKRSYKQAPEEIGGFVLDPMMKTDRTKSRTGDRTALQYGDALEDLLNLSKEAIRYASWAEPLRELQYVYKDNSVRDAIQYSVGSKGLKVIDTKLATFAGNSGADRIIWLDNMTSNAASAILGLKMAPPLKQLISSLYYACDMDAASFAKSFKNVMNIPMDNKSVELMNVLVDDPFFRGRIMNTATARGLEINDMARNLVEFGTSATWAKVKSYIPMRAMRETGGQLVRLGDVAPILAMGSEYVKYKYNKYSGKELDNVTIKRYKEGYKDPFLERAIDDWSFFSEVSQQSLRPANRSHASLNSSLGRAVSLFTSGQLAAHRVASYYGREAIKGLKTGDYKRASDAFAGALIVHALGQGVFYLFDNRGLPEDDKQEKGLALNMALGNLEGIAYWGRVVALTKQYLQDTHYGREGALPLSPVLKNMEVLGESAYKLSNLYSAPVRDMQEINKELVKFGVATSMFTGLPVEGAVKLYKGTKGAFLGAYPILDWRTAALYKEPEDIVPEKIAELNLGAYKSWDDAIEDAESCMAFSKDGMTWKMDTEALKLVAQKVGVSPKTYNDVSAIMMKAVRNKIRKRFISLYNKYNMLDSPEGVDKVIERVRSNWEKAKKDGDKQKAFALYGDLESLMDLKEKKSEMEMQMNDNIIDVTDIPFDIKDLMFDLGFSVEEVGEKEENK